MKKLMFFAVLFLVCFGIGLAQTAPVTIDPAVVAAILSGAFLLGGAFPVSALTELLKRLIFPDEATRPKWSGYLCSAVVSLAMTAAYLLIFHIFTFLAFAVYSVVVFLTSNGFYKFSAK